MINDLITLPKTENRLRPKRKLHLPTIHFQWQAVVSFREGEVLNENLLFYGFVSFGG